MAEIGSDHGCLQANILGYGVNLMKSFRLADLLTC